MQRLRGAEHGAAKRMGDHDVVANFNSEHRRPQTSRIIDELAEYAASGVSGYPEEPCRQARRNDTAGASSASRRGSAQVSASAASSRSPIVSSVARCDGATLPTWLEISLSRRPVERTAERHRRRLPGAVPARVSMMLAACQREVERRGQAFGAGAGMDNTESQSAGAVVRRGEADAKRRGERRRASGSMSTSVTSRAGDAAAEEGDQRADHAGADHRDPP